ncbi:MAG: hypothetical protein JWM90_1853 [Thermoleophilia bacterium]|nr:hypothetical protein [Thermoleophilia bacterium]
MFLRDLPARYILATGVGFGFVLFVVNASLIPGGCITTSATGYGRSRRGGGTDMFCAIDHMWTNSPVVLLVSVLLCIAGVIGAAWVDLKRDRSYLAHRIQRDATGARLGVPAGALGVDVPLPAGGGGSSSLPSFLSAPELTLFGVVRDGGGVAWWIEHPVETGSACLVPSWASEEPMRVLVGSPEGWTVDLGMQLSGTQLHAKLPTPLACIMLQPVTLPSQPFEAELIADLPGDVPEARERVA